MDTGVQMMLSEYHLSLSLCSVFLYDVSLLVGIYLSVAPGSWKLIIAFIAKNPSRRRAPPFHITSQNPRFDSHWPVCNQVLIIIEPISAQKKDCSDWLDQLKEVWPAPPKSELLRVWEGWLNKGMLI